MNNMIRHGFRVLRLQRSVFRIQLIPPSHNICSRAFSTSVTRDNDANTNKNDTNTSQVDTKMTQANTNETNVPSNKGPEAEGATVASELDQGTPLSTEPDSLTTIFEDNDPYMDTYEVFKRLTAAGFTDRKADQIINLLCVQLNSKLSKLRVKYAESVELENEYYLFESAQQEIRVDITRSREQHINELISLTNLLERDFKGINDELNNDFIQMKNDNQVAMSEQKSENTLSSKRIHLKIQETNHKITTELNSAMRSEIESLRWHLSRWGLIAILVSVFSGCTAFYVNKSRTTKAAKSINEFVPLLIYEPSELDEDEYDLDKSP